MYIESCENVNLRVKEWYFRNVFNKEYNVGFGTPLTDACSLCISLKEKLKREMDPQSRSDILIEKRVHSLKAVAFYSLLKDSSEKVFILSFDCEKICPCRKFRTKRHIIATISIFTTCVLYKETRKLV